jgi:LDH2 family malate/lactate/ureidoglycolate dehydrogenase
VSSQDGDSVFRADPLRSFRRELFVACGMAQEDALIVSDGLVQSDLRGSILTASPAWGYT